MEWGTVGAATSASLTRPSDRNPQARRLSPSRQAAAVCATFASAGGANG
jgi:hypothetical protein